MPSSLGELISQTYTAAQTFVGLAVFLMLLYAGIKMMLGKRSEALQIIKDVVIGTILLFSAYIILNTINHDLVQQGSTQQLPQR